MGAEVARYLASGLATRTSMSARARHPCRSRSESKVPHTLCYVRNHSAMVSERRSSTPASAIRCAYLSETTVLTVTTHRAEGVWSLSSGPYADRKSRHAPHMDGLHGMSGNRYLATLAPMLVEVTLCKTDTTALHAQNAGRVTVLLTEFSGDTGLQINVRIKSYLNTS